MPLSEEMKNKIIENNRKITELLNDNENILREGGYNPPATNYALNRTEKNWISFRIHSYCCNI